MRDLTPPFLINLLRFLQKVVRQERINPAHNPNLAFFVAVRSQHRKIEEKILQFLPSIVSYAIAPTSQPKP